MNSYPSPPNHSAPDSPLRNDKQGNHDAEHLRILAIFHYIGAALVALFSSVFIVHVFFGIALMLGSDWFAQGRNPAVQFPGGDKLMGFMATLMGGVAVISGWTMAVLMFIAGRSLIARRRHLFCLIVAGCTCALTPFGTALGVFTIIVLVRPSVKAMFDAPKRMQPY